MPTCRSCGEFVSKGYMRVFAPDAVETKGEVRACPQCTAMRDGADVRLARSKGAAHQEGPIQ